MDLEVISDLYGHLFDLRFLGGRFVEKEGLWVDGSGIWIGRGVIM